MSGDPLVEDFSQARVFVHAGEEGPAGIGASGDGHEGHAALPHWRRPPRENKASRLMEKGREMQNMVLFGGRDRSMLVRFALGQNPLSDANPHVRSEINEWK
jgi:hypothetical protein